MSVKMEIWGETACFTRPEMKAERVSYDIPTPSAARGMLESVYYHPGLKWYIDRIWVLKPIQFTNLRRNEVKSKILGSAILSEANGKGASCIDRSDDIMQRATMMLRDVRYVVEAHFTMTDQANPSDNPGKFQDIVKRRLRRPFRPRRSPLSATPIPSTWNCWKKVYPILVPHSLGSSKK